MSKARRSQKRTCNLGVPRENAVGYCHYHKCRLSKRQMQNRKCLEKGCQRLQRFEEHPYWAQRAKRKEQRQQRKEQAKNENERHVD